MAELLQLLEAADVRATTVPGEVSTPGCWLTLDSLRRFNVAGDYRASCSLYLIHGDTDDLRALEGLTTLLDQVLTVLTPDGEVAAVRVVLPSDPTPLPSLRVPIHL